MNRREFIRQLLAGTAALSLPKSVFAMAQPDKRKNILKTGSHPNIVLILADDMGYSDIGCFGGEINTPNIDKLAKGGIRFTQFYNAARCCPTRASLLTGLYPHQAGMGGMVHQGDIGEPGPYQGYLSDNCVTIAEVLRMAGYKTYMSGKWHVGESRPHWPIDSGFDRYFGLISGAANYFDITKDKSEGIKRQMAMDDQPYMPPKEGFYMTDAFTETAVKFLENHDKNNRPFFLYLAYTAPHWPLHAWPADIAKYKGKYMKGWDELRKERYERMVKMGLINKDLKMSPRDPASRPWEKENKKELMDSKMAVYAAQIECMDRGIGKVFDKISRLGAEENTLIMFLSDNGGCAEGGPRGFDIRKNGLEPGGVDSYMSYGLSWANASNTPFRRYKSWVHEGGIATPLIAYWPAVIKKRDSITHQMGHIIDILPTFCDIAGVKYPEDYKGRKIKPVEGKSLLPIFLGKKRKGHDILYWEHEGNRAVRKGKWKLVAWRGRPWELYDMQADRTELNNLADKNPGKVAELEALYERWAKRHGVKESAKIYP